MDDSTTSSSIGASRRNITDQGGLARPDGRPNKKQSASSNAHSSHPRLSVRKKNEYALLKDESESENISGKENQARQAKINTAKRLPQARPHFNPYRNPPATSLQFASPLARSLPSPSVNARSARPDKTPHPIKHSLTMVYLNDHRPNGDRLDNDNFIRGARKQILTGHTRDNVWMIKSIFKHADYDQYSMDSKCETLMGNTDHIYSGIVPVQEQCNYYEAVEQMYEKNPPGPHGTEIERRRGKVEQLDEGEERTTLKNKLLRDMIWTLTPNQRDTLRQTYPLLYGDHTVADDINWLYFDTVVRLYSINDSSQKKWMLPVIAASEETRIEERNKLMDVIHSRLSPAKRIELKNICKKRHDELLSSREPLLHTAIRTNNLKAVRDYTTSILAFAPPEQRERLLLARSDTIDGKETGEAAFFRMLNSGSEEMIQSFTSTILNTASLTLEQKWNILDARRPRDNVSAFTMLMGLGDWPRVKAFVEVLSGWNFMDFHDLKNPIEPITVDIPGVALAKDVRTYLFKVMLMEGWRRRDWNYGARTNAYGLAMENGHKKCARKLFKLLVSVNRYLALERVSVTSYIRPKNPERVAKDKAMVDAFMKKQMDKRLAMSDEERNEEDKAYMIEVQEAIKTLNSMPSSAQLFADDVKELMMVEDDMEKDRVYFADLIEQDKLKAKERKEKLKTIFASLSPKRPLPGSPEARSLTSRYSFKRTSPTKLPSPRARSMPNIPSMPKFSPKTKSTRYKALRDSSESQGG